MKIDPKFQLEKVTSKDGGRFAITGVSVEKGFAQATNGHALARVPVTMEEGDVDGLIPKEALTIARKAWKFGEVSK